MLKIRMAADPARATRTSKLLSKATFDLSEYVVGHRPQGGHRARPAARGDGGVALHISCHSRAQNMGQKARDMLRLIPEANACR